MNRYTRIVGFLSVMVVGLLVVGQASAVTVSMTTWKTTPQTVGDLTFTWQSSSSNLDGTDTVFSSTAGGLVHLFTIDASVIPGTGCLGPGNYSLTYVVTTTGANTFDKVSYGLSDAVGGGFTFSNTFSPQGLSLVKADEGNLFSLAGATTTVGLTMHLDANTSSPTDDDIVVSFTNTYRQNQADEQVPEIDPSSATGALSFLGIGLAMLLGRRRRRKVG